MNDQTGEAQNDSLQESTPSESPVGPPTPLTYEETPIIEPVAQAPSQTSQLHDAPMTDTPQPRPPVPSSGKPRNLLVGVLTDIILFAVLFALGVWLSTVLRGYLSTARSDIAVPTQTVTQGEGELPQPTPPDPSDPYAGWVAYSVISGATKESLESIRFKLPPEVLSPICDGPTCSSQGTYLPGGSRFTVAARGKGQILADFRGRVVSDLGGRVFTVIQTTVAGKPSTEFSGLFSGTTAGGYTFSQMRGVMIEVDDELSLEINHFTPSGVSAEFSKDDVIFDKIVQSLIVTQFPRAMITPTPTLLKCLPVEQPCNPQSCSYDPSKCSGSNP